MIDCSVAAVTVRAIVFDAIPPWLALMLLVPAARPAITPGEVNAAAELLEEDQRAEVVMSCVLPSAKRPVAVNASLLPFAIEPLGAVMAID